MAELLILANNTATSDAFAWKQGHVIDIKEDGHAWGDQETLPKFWLIKCPGIPASQFAQYLAPQLDASNNMIGIRAWIMTSAAITSLAPSLTVSGVVVSASAATLGTYFQQASAVA